MFNKYLRLVLGLVILVAAAVPAFAQDEDLSLQYRTLIKQYIVAVKNNDEKLTEKYWMQIHSDPKVMSFMKEKFTPLFNYIFYLQGFVYTIKEVSNEVEYESLKNRTVESLLQSPPAPEYENEPQFVGGNVSNQSIVDNNPNDATIYSNRERVLAMPNDATVRPNHAIVESYPNQNVPSNQLIMENRLERLLQK